MRYLIRACSIDAETGGLVLEYLTPDSDVRNNGLVLNHALLVPPEDQFLGLIDQVETVLQEVLQEVLTRFAEAGPLDLPAEDDGPSPYDNPEER